MGDVLARLGEAHAVIGSYGSKLLVSRNEQHARLDEGLEEGDEIALLPPMSGGAGHMSPPTHPKAVAAAIAGHPRETEDGNDP